MTDGEPRPKPLYLDGGRPMCVALDGRALRIRTDRTADRRAPLPRISRVIVWGDVSWSTDALLACADAGISVSFVRGNGIRARLLGRTSRVDDFAGLWSDFLDRPDWRTHFADWHQNLRSRSIRFCAMRLGISPSVLGCMPERSLCGWVAGTEQTDVFLRFLSGIAHARATEELMRLGLDAENTETLRVVSSLVMVLRWGLVPEFERLRPNDPLRSDPVGFFEHCSPTVEYLLGETTTILRRQLERLL